MSSAYILWSQLPTLLTTVSNPLNFWTLRLKPISHQPPTILHWTLSRESLYPPTLSEIEVEVTLRLTVSQSVCLGIEHPCETCNQILPPVGMLSEICGLVSVGRPLWREDGSAICSVITQWSESRRTRSHTLLSHLRLSQPGGPGSRVYIPQEQGGPVIPPGTPFPLRRHLRLAFYDW
jgi:hypothetical protein